MPTADHLLVFQRLDDRLLWLEARRNGDRPALLGWGSEPFEADTKDALDDAASRISLKLNIGLFTQYDTILAAPAHRVTARFMETPPADEDAVAGLVSFEVGEALNLEIEDIAWDYWISTRHGEGDTRRLLWIAARKKFVSEWLEGWPSNRLPVSQVSPDVWAFYEYALRAEGGLLSQPALMVCESGGRAELIAADAQGIYYTRVGNAGDGIASEIERTLSYISGRTMDGEARRLIVIGFEDTPPDRFAPIAEAHRLTLHRLGAADLAAMFKLECEPPGPETCSLMTLAYARLGAGLEGVNLLDKKQEAAWGAMLMEKARPSGDFIRNAAILAAAVLMVWIGGSIWFNQAVEARLEEGKSLIQLAQRLEKEENALRAMSDKAIPVADILLYLAELLPKEKKILVKTLQMDDSDGIVMSFVGGSNQDIVELIDKMNESRFFRDMASDRAVMENDGIVIYVSGKLRKGA